MRDQLGNPMLRRYPLDGESCVPYTWREHVEELKEGITTALCNSRDWPPQYHEYCSDEFALSVTEELI